VQVLRVFTFVLGNALGLAAAADYSAPEGSFEFGLQAILDGLEAQLTAHRSPPRSRTTRRPGHGS
jgi:hypothetical protein